jgi:hypothetical protein
LEISTWFYELTKYRLEQLKSLCETSIQQWVDMDNAVYLLQAAELHSAFLLKEYCTNFILKQLDLINVSDTTTCLSDFIEDLSFRKKLLRIKTVSCVSDSESDRDDKSPKITL